MRTSRGFRRSTSVVAGLASILALGACGSEEKAEDSGVTIKHAYGETVVPEDPQRVATWGWGSTEAALAVGVYPVAVAEQVWTVGEDKLLPWVEKAYDDAGVDHPAILDDSKQGAEVPYDEFTAARPDVIVAPYSGLTEEQYDTLSEIAPVVAFPEAAWTTSWDDTIRITAEALGKAEEGEKVLADIDDYLADEAAKHPEFEGKTLAGIWADPKALSVYTERDSRVGILTKLGFEIAPSVSALDTSDGGFYYELSYEKADQLESDVVVSYHASDKDVTTMLGDRRARAIPAVGAGKVAPMVGTVNVSSVSPPTALSFTWEDGLPALIEKLAQAVAKK